MLDDISVATSIGLGCGWEGAWSSCLGLLNMGLWCSARLAGLFAAGSCLCRCSGECCCRCLGVCIIEWLSADCGRATAGVLASSSAVSSVKGRLVLIEAGAFLSGSSATGRSWVFPEANAACGPSGSSSSMSRSQSLTEEAARLCAWESLEVSLCGPDAGRPVHTPV